MVLRERLGLQDKIELVTPERVREQENARRATTLCLPAHLPPTCINFVDSHPALCRAAASIHTYIFEAREKWGVGGVKMWKEAAVGEVMVVGLDVEWKPCMDGAAKQNPASILQIAWRCVYVCVCVCVLQCVL